jgi:hypothetical protein
VSQTTPNMGLTAWNLGGDFFNYAQLLANFNALDDHDHTPTNGVLIPTGGIANLAITTAKIADLGVTTAKINDDAVTQAKIANDAVGADQIVADSVGASEIAPLSITGAEVANGTLAQTKLNIQVLWGGFNPDGSVAQAGSGGWTPSKTGTGTYTVNWTTNFSAIPIVICHPMYRGAWASVDYMPDVGYDPMDAIGITMSVGTEVNVPAGELDYDEGDYGCYFIAIGPR